MAKNISRDISGRAERGACRKARNQKSSDYAEVTTEHKSPSPVTTGARNSCPKILVIAFLLSAIVLAIALNFQTISDLISSFGYTPSPEISSARDSLNLSGDGQRIFNASRPEFSSKSNFNEICNAHQGDISVLGCYTNKRIYVYNITTDQLQGVKESTLAHELLHAVWARLSQDEKDKLGSQLEEVAHSEKYQKLLEEDLKTYGDTERIEELHSRVGTEVKDLPEVLEQHYAKYFQDQDYIVAYYESYSAPFKKLKAQIATLSNELEALKTQIETETKEYETRADSLNSAISEFNNCASTPNCFANRTAFNSRRAELVAEQTTVNNLYVSLDQTIKNYNQKVTEYNDNVLKNKDLENLINSNSKVNNI